MASLHAIVLISQELCQVSVIIVTFVGVIKTTCSAWLCCFRVIINGNDKAALGGGLAAGTVVGLDRDLDQARVARVPRATVDGGAVGKVHRAVRVFTTSWGYGVIPSDG